MDTYTSLDQYLMQKHNISLGVVSRFAIQSDNTLVLYTSNNKTVNIPYDKKTLNVLKDHTDKNSLIGKIWAFRTVMGDKIPQYKMYGQLQKLTVPQLQQQLTHIQKYYIGDAKGVNYYLKDIISYNNPNVPIDVIDQLTKDQDIVTLTKLATENGFLNQKFRELGLKNNKF
jgi:hypothetical protein